MIHNTSRGALRLLLMTDLIKFLTSDRDNLMFVRIQDSTKYLVASLLRPFSVHVELNSSICFHDCSLFPTSGNGGLLDT